MLDSETSYSPRSISRKMMSEIVFDDFDFDRFECPYCGEEYDSSEEPCCPFCDEEESNEV